MLDEEIIHKLKISPQTKVLDVGGSMHQHTLIKIDTLVDLIRPEDSPYGQARLNAKNFVRVDLTQDKLPFNNKEFDVVLCTHTLEDLTNPFLAIQEMSRVAKRGYISTPSMGEDMVFSHVDKTSWLTGFRRTPGLAHHKWFFWLKGKKMVVIPKNYPLLYSPEFMIVGWQGEKEFNLFWERSIDYIEIIDIDFHNLVSVYRDFVGRNSKSIVKGRPLLYVDNPFFFMKETLKDFLKRGSGYKKGS